MSESRTGYATSYTYDGNGNRKTRVVNGTTETYTYDAGDKLTGIAYSAGGSRSFTYDLSGRMLTDSLNTRAFSWTADSRLASLTASTGNESYTYSAFGTRVKVGTRTFLRAGAGATASVLDDGNAEYTPGVSEVRSGTTTFSHSGLKSMGAQSSSGGSVAATNTYDAFGGVVGSTGTWPGPFGAAGAFGYQTEGSSLHLLGHRYYDSSLGRFVSRDPAGDGSNWYAYCENNPTRLVDPSGLWSLDRFLVTGDGNASDDVYDGGLRQLDDSWTRWQGHFADENRVYGPIAAGLLGVDGLVYPGVPKPKAWKLPGASPYTTPIRLLDVWLRRKLGIAIPKLALLSNGAKQVFVRFPVVYAVARYAPLALLYGEVYLAIRAGRSTMREPILEPVLTSQGL